MPMSSRQSNDTTSGSGVKYSATENTSSMPTKNVSYSGGVVQSTALRGLVGTTIRGQVVGPLEHWADGTIWDTTNNRSLSSGSDFDPAILHRGGF
jgi:hypothetical protein